MRILPSILFIVFLFCSFQGEAQVLSGKREAVKLSDQEKADLAKWNSRFIADLGRIAGATPLRQSEDLAFIQNNLEQIINTLAGERLKKEGKQVIVHVYSSAIPNAFVHRAEPNQILSKLYPTIKLDKPIYEIGFTYALWKNIRTLDEAAFVLAHELTHLLEGHTDGKDSAHEEDVKERLKEWFSSHRLESIADHMALKMMVGKYNLEAGIRALWMLSRRVAPEISVEHRFMSIMEEVLSTHPSDSLRISMAQFNAENLVRTEKLAAPRPEIVIHPSGALKYRGAKAESLIVSDENIQSRESVFKDAEFLWKNFIIKKKLLDKDIFSDETREKLESNNWERRPRQSDYIDAMKFLIQKVNASKMSPAEKGNALWDIFSFYEDWNHRVIEATAYKGNDLYIQNRPYRELWAPVLLKAVRAGWTGKDLYGHRLRGITEDNKKTGGSAQDLKEMLSLYMAEVFSSNEHDVIDSMLKYRDIAKIYKDLQLLVFMPDGKINFENVMSGFGILNMRDDVEKINGDRLFQEVFSELINLPEVKEEYIRRTIEEPHSFMINLRRADKIRKKIPQYTIFKKAMLKDLTDLRKSYVKDIKNGDLDHNKIRFTIETFEYFRHTAEEKKEIANVFLKASQISYDQKYVDAGMFRPIYYFQIASLLQLPKKERAMLMSYIASKYLAGAAADSRADAILKQNLSDFSTKEMLQLLELPWPSLERQIQEVSHSEEVKSLEDKIASLNLKGKSKDEIFNIFFNNHRGLQTKAQELLSRTLGGPLDSRMNAAKNWLMFMNSVDRFDPVPGDTVQRVFKILNSKIPERYIVKHHPLIALATDTKIEKLSDKSLDTEIVSGLFKLHVAATSDKTDFKRWISDLERIHQLNKVAMDSAPEVKQRLENIFLRFAKKDPALAYHALGKKSVRSLLTAEAFVTVIMPTFVSRLPHSRSAQELAATADNIDRELKLKRQLPDVFSALRNEVAVKYKVQPHTVETILPSDQLIINTKTTSEFDQEIRGMSTFTSLAKEMKAHEVIEMIEYVMGRSEQVPPVIQAWNDKHRVPLSDLLRALKIRLIRENVILKSFVINSLIAGPSGFMENQEGREIFLNHIFKEVKTNKEIIRELFVSLLESQPYNKTLPISYILAQGSGGQKLTEGDLIRASFEAFGAAGIKLGQYLAFTGEFQDYRTALAALQDSAMPLTYLQMVRLLESRYGKDWNSKIVVTKVLGSGSVNVAVEVYNRSTRRMEVISVLRKDIEISAKEDFRKLDLFIKKFIERSGSNQYQYLLGLIKIIESSVQLEFNKANAFDVQKEAVRLYDFQLQEWKYQSIVPYSLDPDAIRMEKAPGKTAKHFRENNPAIYKEVMSGFLKRELDILLGTHPTLKDAAFIANPDIHDGQILIEPNKKIVSVLDFGQAIKISQKERLLALELLMMLEMSRDQSSFNKYLKRVDQSYLGNKNPSIDEINQFLKRTDRMDRFIYLMGILKSNGSQIPMASIHWILGMNRAIKLGESVGVNVESTLRNALIANRLGASLETFNQVRNTLTKLVGFGTQTLESIKSWMAPVRTQEPASCRHLFAQ